MPPKHSKNLIRDGDFIHSFSDLISVQSEWTAGHTLVGREKAVVALSDAFRFTTNKSNWIATAAAPYPPMSIAKMAKMIRRSITLPWSGTEKRLLKPAPWRDVTDQLKAVFFHFALRARGTSYRFDLNLSPDIAAAARGKGNKACEFIRRRVARELRKVLDSPAEFVLALEEDGIERRLHVHGTLSIPSDRRMAARKALEMAGGEWDGVGGQHQVNMRPQQINPDLRGGTYIVKNVARASPKGRALSKRLDDKKRLPKFEGRPMAVTRGIRQDAEKLYVAARKLVIDYRKGAGRRS